MPQEPRVFPLLALVLSTSLVGALRVVDLTHNHNNQSMYWPGNQPFVLKDTSDLATGKWHAKWIGTPEHSGSHMDAPSHIIKGGAFMHEIPVERLVGPGVVIDVREQFGLNQDYETSLADVQGWEKRNGQIPEGAIVLLNSGNGEHYFNRRKYLNSNNIQDVRTFHFPAFSVESVLWMMQHRKISMIGTDSASCDVGPSTDFPVHQAILSRDVYCLENVANLGALPESGATIVVGALKLQDGTGTPARILALVADSSAGVMAASGLVAVAVTVAVVLKILS